MKPWQFDPVEMRKLYDFGFNQMMENWAWHTQQAPMNLEELENLLNLYDLLPPLIRLMGRAMI